MPRFPAATLTDFGERLFQALGAPPDIAQRVSASLVQADLYGVTSHGFGLTLAYARAIQSGTLLPAGRPAIARENAVTALVDGGRGFGQVAAEFAMRTAIDKACAHGAGVVAGVHCGHIGRIGEYTEMAAKAGLIGVTMVNANPIVTPFGGAARRIGTNPIAFSVPVPGGRPILVDFATSVVAANKVRVARAKGARIPVGWIVDNEGADTDDPNAYYAGGYLLTVNQHKGYGLSLMIEVLAGLLSGTGAAPVSFKSGNGVFLFALAPDFFRPADEFLDDVRRLAARLRETPPRAGVPAVLVPGDPEYAAEERHARLGVELDETTWGELLALGAAHAVEYREPTEAEA